MPVYGHDWIFDFGQFKYFFNILSTINQPSTAITVSFLTIVSPNLSIRLIKAKLYSLDFKHYFDR